MGKKQHQKDKLYLTNTEWREEWGGKKAAFPCSHLNIHSGTKDGVIFDLLLCKVKELVKLNFHRMAEDKYHCPVTFKSSITTHDIVAVKPTGNVFSYDAVEQLNLKAKNFKDLLTDEPFTRKDIITIQDPTSLDKFNLANFHHLKNNLKVVNEEEEKAKKDPKYYLNRANKDTLSILSELEKTYKEPLKYLSTQQEAAIVDQDTVRYREVKKKVMCDFKQVMETLTWNSIVKCFSQIHQEFYDSRRDPTGTGRGGESAWGEPFKDEFKPNLIHQGRGILSMANSGPSTNKSQFFITYRSCRHLDEKHSVFGRLVGGLETLSAMERVEVDEKDRPKEVIKLFKAVVFTNPFEEVDTV
ncbi:RING-type E3 ubiquitin-protein ligase ppil2, partial [Desmophyllum pertusum]